MPSSSARIAAGAALLGLLSGSGLIGPIAGSALAQGHGRGSHGTPSGWRLHWPAGDPARGREAFLKFDCGSCHEVRGQRLPAPSARDTIGPELSMMGPLHPPEYFVEAVINPSATIEPKKGYAAADGSSKMPAFNDTMTVQELIDLVAYLRSLKPPRGARTGPRTSGGHGAHPGTP